QALSIVRDEGWRRKQLRALIAAFRKAAGQLTGVELLPSITPIQPLLVGDASRAVVLAERLADRGLLVPAIRPPTVPPGGSRLRVTFSAAHEMVDLDRLLSALRECTILK
ncbi:MAG TPA: 8-amino-7-oxononanoate synthase, partial [Guyparkeria sp.]|nr:8-amino-7-oxononanoate synthase [Guyparkeria sp.]